MTGLYDGIGELIFWACFTALYTPLITLVFVSRFVSFQRYSVIQKSAAGSVFYGIILGLTVVIIRTFSHRVFTLLLVYCGVLTIACLIFISRKAKLQR